MYKNKNVTISTSWYEELLDSYAVLKELQKTVIALLSEYNQSVESAERIRMRKINATNHNQGIQM